MDGFPHLRRHRHHLRLAALLAALAIGCSSTAEHRSLFIEAEGGSGGSGLDAGQLPESAAGGPSEGGTREAEAGADAGGPKVGDQCLASDGFYGIVCLLHPDASYPELGCARLVALHECEPFPDAG